ncbi:MAG: hypothetical protein KKA42_13850, partial [candidate division Zixibacteria bacterium]|nr:hypothetical protein [candidate division Zixibacteria bacterium]
VIGALPSGEILTGVPITFRFRMINEGPGCYNVCNGYRVWSPEGIPFTSVQGTRLRPWWDMNWTSNFANHFEWDGAEFVPAAGGVPGPATGSDVAISFSAVTFAKDDRHCSFNFPPWFDDVTYEITIEPIDAQYAGGTICIDSTFTPPTGAWRWAEIHGLPWIIPEWDGPHCFTVTNECCVGEMRGNADYDDSDEIDIGDATVLITHLFIDFEPLDCHAEADVDGTGVVDISDLTIVLRYLFRDGPAPDPCP